MEDTSRSPRRRSLGPETSSPSRDRKVDVLYIGKKSPEKRKFNDGARCVCVCLYAAHCFIVAVHHVRKKTLQKTPCPHRSYLNFSGQFYSNVVRSMNEYAAISEQCVSLTCGSVAEDSYM